MQDNIVYRLELTDKEYEFIENLRNELYDKFSKMSKDELRQYFENLCIEQNLNFEKEIKGTVYKVNTYFNKDSEHTILTSNSFCIEFLVWNMVYYKHYLKCSNYNFISYFELSRKGVNNETARKR